MYWKFTSSGGWFSTELPENWLEYEDDEGTYAFSNTEKWSGNLRITPYRWKKGRNKALTYIQGELSDNSNAVLTKVGVWDAAFYSKEADSDSLIYFWITGFKNTVFLCSFSVDKESIGTEIHGIELAVVEKILSNIRLN